MDSSTYQLRISAKKLSERIFYDVQLKDFFDFAGYTLSAHALSVDKRAEALAANCTSPKGTTRRWITGESQPNGTNTFMIYAAMLGVQYNGNQVKLLYDFLKWHDPSLLPKYFQEVPANSRAS